MGKGYIIQSNSLQPCPLESATIIVLDQPSLEKKEWLAATWGISHHTINSALDPSSEARLDFEDDHVAIVLNLPKNYSQEQKLLFGVRTMGMFLFSDTLIIVHPSEDLIIDEGSRHHKIHDPLDVMLRIFGGAINHFSGHLKVIAQISESLESKVTGSMANDYLMGMFALEKSLVYYLAALGANTTLLEKLRGNARRLKFDEDHLDFLDDLLIDIRQANRLAEIYSNILNNLMEARGTIVNNNMNQLIKRLTIISVVLMPLNLIAGIGGMSEFSVMTGPVPYWISYPALVLGLSLIGWITYRVLKRLS